LNIQYKFTINVLKSVDQTVYGGRDVLVRLGSIWGDMGVAEAVEGLGGEVEGESVFTSYPSIIVPVFR
jgi:hypothetical protein